MAFQTHPLIPLNSTNSMALSKIQFFSSDYVKNPIFHVIISSHSNKSVSKYFINDLRQNSLYLVSSTTLIWYWKCTLTHLHLRVTCAYPKVKILKKPKRQTQCAVNFYNLSSHGNQVDNQTWFDATLVYKFNECYRRNYDS